MFNQSSIFCFSIDFIAKNEGGDSASTSQKSPRFVTKEIVEDLNKKMEEGTAQLKQLVDSGQLQQGLTLSLIHI